MLLKLLPALAAVLCVTTGRDGSSNLSSEAVGWTSTYSDSNRHLWKYLSLETVERIFRFLINSFKNCPYLKSLWWNGIWKLKIKLRCGAYTVWLAICQSIWSDPVHSGLAEYVLKLTGRYYAVERQYVHSCTSWLVWLIRWFGTQPQFSCAMGDYYQQFMCAHFKV